MVDRGEGTPVRGSQRSREGLGSGQPVEVRGGDDDSLSSLATAPIDMMRQLVDQMSKMLNDAGLGGIGSVLQNNPITQGLSELGRSAMERAGWSPQIDIYQRGQTLVIHADLPGMRRDEIQVEIADDALIVSGERRKRHDEGSGSYYRSERGYGAFRREIPLPEMVDTSTIQATFRDGVLEITLQARGERRAGRRVEVQG